MTYVITLFQVAGTKQFYFQGRLVQKPAADFIIVEYPDGLPVPGLSSAAPSVPAWNMVIKDFLKYIIGFCGGYLHDDEALLIFYPESTQIRREIESYLKNNDLKVKDEWTIINSMHLSHPTNPSKFVSS